MKQTISVFLHARERPSWMTDGDRYSFTVWPDDMSSAGYIPLGRTDFEFDVPSEEKVIARHTVLLRRKIADVYETAEKQASELREQLSKLEALTYTPPSGEGA